MSMTREEAIKFAHHAYDMTDIPDVKDFYAVAENALREQVERRWIPVTERLPEVGRSVIAYNAPARCAAEAVYKGEGKFLQFRWAARLQEQEVTHWMPLPEPVKEATPCP